MDLFFSKCGNFDLDFKNAIKTSEKVFGFGDNYVWACCRNFPQFWRQNMSFAIKVLKKSRNPSHLTRTDVFQLNLSESNEKLG